MFLRCIYPQESGLSSGRDNQKDEKMTLNCVLMLQWGPEDEAVSQEP